MVLMIVKGRLAWVLFLSAALWSLQLATQAFITCHCNLSHGVNHECRMNDHICQGVLCSLTRILVENGDPDPFEEVLYECQTTLLDTELCKLNTTTRRRVCCMDRNLCNLNLTLEPFFPPTTSSPTTITTAIDGNSSSTVSKGPTDNLSNPIYKQVTIAVPICSALIILFIIVTPFTVLYLLRRRKQRIERRRSESHRHNNNNNNTNNTNNNRHRSNNNNNTNNTKKGRRGKNKSKRDLSPVYTPYSLETLELDDQTCTSGSGSGAPLLIQRTIARCIRVSQPIGSGRFGQVFVGEYQGDMVAVKKFASRDEHSWFRETEIYNTVLLRHDNVLGYVASDVYSENGVTELWLVTQFHPHGSLYDYVSRQTVSPKILMRMAVSLAKGLTHLHTEFSGTSAKPPIAHRDIKSKNVLVKNNLECCIADFGLAVIKGPASNVNFPTNPKQGTKRYMAPEVLAETIDMKKFESFPKTDIYAFGLVLWELCKRCADKNDSVGEYEPPFHGKVGPDPSFEEMKKVVVVDRQQPTIPDHWHSSDLLHKLAGIMKECWYIDAKARNQALYYKLKLQEYAIEDKIDYDIQE